MGLVYQAATGVLGNLTYSYDAEGNRQTMGGTLSQVLLPGPITGGIYDPANRQLSFGDKSMAYDPNGNLVTLTDPTGTTSFTWDSRNRLTALSATGLQFQAKYDTANRRIEQAVNGQHHTYRHDGPDVVQTSFSDGTEVNYLGSLQIDEVLARDTSEGYLTEALGSVVALVDASGVIATQYQYSPFGVPAPTGLGSTNPFKFTGREHDGTGLYYYRNRYYDPRLKRFISEDPLGLAVGVNLYAYVENNPVSYTDPFGLCRDPGGKGIRFCMETFIPADDIGFGIKGDGDDRSYNPDGGTYRTHQEVNVDLQSRTSEGRKDTGPTRGPYGREGKASGSTLEQDVEWTRDGGAIVRISGNESIPTIPGAPGITVDLKIKISDKGEMCVTGDHDGFPGYELWVYREGRPPVPLYGFMPSMSRKRIAPLKLLPPAEIPVKRKCIK